MLSAARDLLGLGINGIQLTPGNVPTPGFQEWLSRQQVSTRTHHGFHPKALRRRVWSKEADCLVSADSVHPLQIKDGITEIWKQKAERGDYDRVSLETMYPGYCLGCGDELSWAMDLGLKLAVDVSHIYIQLCSGSLDLATWYKLQKYDRIGELHVSANNGLADIHQPMTTETFGLDWVRDRAVDGTPVILECYMHRLSDVQRREQIGLITD
jgi:hypothetical protein